MKQTAQEQAIVRTTIPLSEITVDPAIQIRTKADEAVVERYRAIIREQGRMESIHLFSEDGLAGPLVLADGFRRVAAYAAEKVDAVPAKIHKGGHSEALEFAIHQNCHHGTPTTNADKRHAAEMAVTDPKLGNYSDKHLAYLIGVSTTLIGDVRRGESPEAKSIRHKEIKERKERKEGGTGVVPVVAHQRRAPDSDRPTQARTHDIVDEEVMALFEATRARTLKQIESFVNNDIVDEDDVVALFEAGNGKYVFLPKPGQTVLLTITDRDGAERFRAWVAVVDARFEGLKLSTNARFGKENS